LLDRLALASRIDGDLVVAQPAHREVPCFGMRKYSPLTLAAGVIAAFSVRSMPTRRASTNSNSLNFSL